MIKLALLFLLCWISPVADTVKNGTAALVIVDRQTPRTVVAYHNFTLPLYNHPVQKNKQFVLVPVDYYAKNTKQTVYFKDANTTSYVFYSIRGEYAKESLSVNPDKVHPPKSARKRIEQEYLIARKVFSNISPSRLWSKRFILPMQSEITSAFGTARMFNGVLKRYHTGADFKAVSPTPVLATNNGIVVLRQARYFSGNTVIIDHGKGLFSCYYHLSKMQVKEGQKVLRGDSIGLSGKSGRVTGPHLHFAMVVHDVKVDPIDLVDKLNSLFR